MSRPVIKFRGTMVDANEVFLQVGNALHSFGSLSMPIREYKAFKNSLLNGSLNSGSEGFEAHFDEEGFDQWGGK